MWTFWRRERSVPSSRIQTPVLLGPRLFTVLTYKHELRPIFLDITLFGHVARKGEKRNAYWVFVEKPEGKRPSDFRGIDGRTNVKTAV